MKGKQCILISPLPSEALRLVKRVQGTFEKTADVELESAVAATMMRAQATKHNACCLVVLQKEKDAGLARSKLQAEIRELRAEGLREAEVLHPIIWSRIQKAMACRL